MALTPEEIAEMTNNTDVNIALEDAKFADNQVVRAVIKKVEKVPLINRDDEGLTGEGIRIIFETEESLTATDGDIKQPGTTLRPFPYKIKPAEQSASKAAEMSSYAWKDLGRIAQAAGTLGKQAAATPAVILKAVNEAEGKRVQLKLSLDKKGYQRIDVSALGR